MCETPSCLQEQDVYVSELSGLLSDSQICRAAMLQPLWNADSAALISAELVIVMLVKGAAFVSAVVSVRWHDEHSFL